MCGQLKEVTSTVTNLRTITVESSSFDQQHKRIMMITKLKHIVTTSHSWKQGVSQLLLPGESMETSCLKVPQLHWKENQL